jgi:hypothetical protein
MNELIKNVYNLSIEINPHKSYYQSIIQYLNSGNIISNDIPENILIEIIQHNSLIEIQVYPDNAIDYFTIYHYDIDKAVKEALKNINI